MKFWLTKILVALESTRVFTEKVLKVLVAFRIIRRYNKVLQILRALIVGY